MLSVVPHYTAQSAPELAITMFTPNSSLAAWNAKVVASGDMNGDGWIDLVFGTESFPTDVDSNYDWIYFNDGKGNFSDSDRMAFGNGRDRVFALALADFDNDDDLDIVTGNLGQPSLVYINNSKGIMTETRLLNTNAPETRAVAVADFDDQRSRYLSTAQLWSRRNDTIPCSWHPNSRDESRSASSKRHRLSLA